MTNLDYPNSSHGCKTTKLRNQKVCTHSDLFSVSQNINNARSEKHVKQHELNYLRTRTNSFELIFIDKFLNSHKLIHKVDSLSIYNRCR